MKWNLGMDMYVSTIAGEPARPRTDAHADGSTFVSRKATVTDSTANSKRTLFADALKAYRNHKSLRLLPLASCEIVRAISFNAGRISLYDRNWPITGINNLRGRFGH